MTDIVKRPWYQEPYVWLVIFFPSLAVVGGMITITLAITSYDGLVVDDYYKQGLQINKKLDRDKAAGRHGLRAFMAFNVSDNVIVIELDKQADYELPSSLNIVFSHRTRAGFDTSLSFERMEGSIYRGQLPDLIAGKWTVELAADDWRLIGAVKMPMPMTREFLIEPTY
ncbi:FixH family protein [Candidatus Albibeggiatoa sp. nov. BB20]|uniref:FixH family protein n=1 Tax=Candidatus Albibeggiatoa sp. nov. BB20 TaxID=3162723 RepID=UPI003365AE93